MSGLTIPDAIFIGTVLEGLFYGLYCIVFVLYIRIHTSRKSADILIYPLSMLFILCTVYFALDFAQEFFTVMRRQEGHPLVWSLESTTSAIYSFIDFIAQGVLIYRCWVVWNYRLLIVPIPFILALTSLATSLALVVELNLLGVTRGIPTSDLPIWFRPVGVFSFSLSLAVNAIFTGLLVFKIAKASLEPRDSLVRSAQGRNDIRLLVPILIESGMVLFLAQLLWIIFFSLDSNGFQLIGGLITMLYGTIPTLIVVRVGMRDAYKFQSSSTSSLETNMRFASADENSPPRPPLEDLREYTSMEFPPHPNTASVSQAPAKT